MRVGPATTKDEYERIHKEPKHVLMDYTNAIKERLKEKTGWGRNELAKVIDEELVKALLEQ